MKTQDLQRVVFVSLQKNTDPKANHNERFPKNVSIPTIARIFDHEKETERIIQYTKGQKTIYQDEMTGNPKPEPSKEPIMMRDGLLICNPKEKTLIEYLKKSYISGNTDLLDGNPIYSLQNFKLSTEKELERIYEDTDLILDIRKMNPLELAGLSMVMGDANATTKDVSENRWNLTVLAKKEPERIRKALGDKKIPRKANIMLAEKENIIVIDNKARMVRWAEGSKIIGIPVGLDGLDYFVDMTFQPEFADVYSTIRQRLGLESAPTPEVDPYAPVFPKVDPSATVFPVSISEEPAEEVNPVEVFLDQCLESNLLKNKAIWWSLEGAKKGDEYHNFVQGGKRKMIEYIEKNPDFKTFLETKIAELV